MKKKEFGVAQTGAKQRKEKDEMIKKNEISDESETVLFDLVNKLVEKVWRCHRKGEEKEEETELHLS